MKTKIILFASIIMFGFSVMAQQVEINQKLYAKYDKAYLEKLQKENPEQLKKMNFFADHFGYIIDMPDKPIEHKDLIRLSDNSKNITLEELKDFNPYLYNCKNDLTRTTYYKIGNTGKLLIVRSLQDLNRMYDNYTKTLKNN